MKKTVDTIELVLPFKAEYVSVARLTASGIASRIGFDYETIEDIKVALAEVCNKMVFKGSKIASDYSIVFEVTDKELNIVFKCKDESLKCIFDDDKEGLGVSIIMALMDKVVLCPDSSNVLSMSKVLEGNG